MVNVGILSLGSCTPKTKVTNRDWARHIDTSDEWIRERTGIVTRGFASKEEPLPVMIAVAARNALDDGGFSAKEIDYILVGTNGTGPFVFPHEAAIVQDLICAREISCQNVQAGCCGAVQAVENAVRIIRDAKQTEGRDVKALVIGGDTLSHILDVKNRENAVVLGDGAGAMILGPIADEKAGIRHMFNKADGSQGQFIYTKSGYACPLVGTEPVKLENRLTLPGTFMMDGRSVHEFVGKKAAETVKELVEKSGFALEDLVSILVVPHQMNLRSIQMAGRRMKKELGYEPEMYVESIVEDGNTSTASTIIGLDKLHRAGRLKKYQPILVASFGAGLTWGGYFMLWNRESSEGKPYDPLKQAELAKEAYEKYQKWEAKLPVKKEPK